MQRSYGHDQFSLPNNPLSLDRAIVLYGYLEALRDALIDWEDDPSSLLAGNITKLQPDVAAAISKVAKHPKVIAVAEALELNPVILVIALIAENQSSFSRSAARIAENVLGKVLMGGPLDQLPSFIVPNSIGVRIMKNVPDQEDVDWLQAL
jgi:hypothetical protein